MRLFSAGSVLTLLETAHQRCQHRRVVALADLNISAQRVHNPNRGDIGAFEHGIDQARVVLWLSKGARDAKVRHQCLDFPNPCRAGPGSEASDSDIAPAAASPKRRSKYW